MISPSSCCSLSAGRIISPRLDSRVSVAGGIRYVRVFDLRELSYCLLAQGRSAVHPSRPLLLGAAKCARRRITRQRERTKILILPGRRRWCQREGVKQRKISRRHNMQQSYKSAALETIGGDRPSRRNSNRIEVGSVDHSEVMP